jgi:hypothetical protein
MTSTFDSSPHVSPGPQDGHKTRNRAGVEGLPPSSLAPAPLIPLHQEPEKQTPANTPYNFCHIVDRPAHQAPTGRHRRHRDTVWTQAGGGSHLAPQRFVATQTARRLCRGTPRDEALGGPPATDLLWITTASRARHVSGGQGGQVPPWSGVGGAEVVGSEQSRQPAVKRGITTPGHGPGRPALTDPDIADVRGVLCPPASGN